MIICCTFLQSNQISTLRPQQNWNHYESPSSGEACSDRQLTTNFELWVEIFCASTYMFPYEDSKTLSVCLYPEKKNHPSFVNISPTLVIDTSMERSSRVVQQGNPKIWFSFFKEVRNWILTCILNCAEELKSTFNMHLYDDIGDASSIFCFLLVNIFFSYIIHILFFYT